MNIPLQGKSYRQTLTNINAVNIPQAEAVYEAHQCLWSMVNYRQMFFSVIIISYRFMSIISLFITSVKQHVVYPRVQLYIAQYFVSRSLYFLDDLDLNTETIKLIPLQSVYT